MLCANKCDLALDEDSNELISEEMIPIMEEFKEIESCIRASAKVHYNVNQVFDAQSRFLHIFQLPNMVLGFLFVPKGYCASHCASVRLEGTELKATHCGCVATNILYVRYIIVILALT